MITYIVKSDLTVDENSPIHSRRISVDRSALTDEVVIVSDEPMTNEELTGMAVSVRANRRNPVMPYSVGIEKVKFSGPATIVFWVDGSKTVVKCQEGDTFDPEKGLALCFMKKVLGNKSGRFNKVLKMYGKEEEDEH